MAVEQSKKVEYPCHLWLITARLNEEDTAACVVDYAHSRTIAEDKFNEMNLQLKNAGRETILELKHAKLIYY